MTEVNSPSESGRHPPEEERESGGHPPTTNASRLLAMIVRVTGFLGMGLSLVALIAAPFFWRAAAEMISQALDVAQREVESGSTLIHLAADSIDSASGALAQSSSTLAAAQQSLGDAAPILESTSLLLEEQAPLTLTETREAIIAAEAGAQAIDSFLRALAVLRPLTGVEYSAEDSLAAGLVDAAESLEPLPQDFAELGAQISGFSENLDQMDGELGELAEGMVDLADSLERAAQALRRQARDLGELAERMEAARPRVDRWSEVLGWATGAVFLWVLVSQYGLFALGGMLLRPTERAIDAETQNDEPQGQ